MKLDIRNKDFVKRNILCYKFFDNRIVKTEIVDMLRKKIVVDLGLNSSFKVFEDYCVNFERKKLVPNFSLNINSDNSIFIDITFCDNIKKKFFVMFYLRQLFDLKKLFEGRTCKVSRNGLLVFLNGYVCLLPFKNCYYSNFEVGRLNIFFVSNFFETFEKGVFLSQRNIHKKLHYSLLKLSSKMSLVKVDIT